MCTPTFLLAISALLGLCSAQAPGDEDRVRCVESSTYRHTHPDNVKVLLDSWNYEQLLPGHGDQHIPGAVWTDASCDNNDDAQFPFITPPYWQHGAGGICRWQAQVCGYTVGDQNNWLFTQHISKAVPATDLCPVRVFVNVTYSFQSCRTRNRCNPQFRLLKYISNYQQQPKRDVCSDTSRYSGSGIMPSYTIESESTDGVASDMRYFDMSTSQDGLYLALQDVSVGNLRGTCVGINRLIVYRYQCPAQAVGLVRYPATQAPVSGTKTVTTRCVDNAHKKSSNLNVQCDSNGHWSSGSPECECDLGYREVTRDGRQVCEACPAGTYHSFGDTDCRSCPANTMRDQVATGQCQCQYGYFRNDVTRDNTCSSLLTASNERAGTGCSQPPSAPASVSVSAVSGRSITVTWSRPSERGGRSDLHYTLDHSDPDTRGRYIGTTCKGSSSTSHTFTGLRPDTLYCIRVSAHNGVSDQDPDREHLRTVEQCTRTPPPPPGRVTDVQDFYPVVLWGPPNDLSRAITGYELTFTRGGRSNTVTTTLPYYVIQSQDDPGSSGNFSVEVKARSSAGTGPGTSIVIRADPTCPTCPTPQACDSCCPTCSTPPPCDSCCIDPPACDSCCRDCPTCDSCCTDRPPCDSCCEGFPSCPTDPPVTPPDPAVPTPPLESTTCPPPLQCPTCPAPVNCTTCPTCPPAVDCPTCPTVECPVCTETPASTVEIRRPGTVRNVNAFNCSAIVWEPPEDDGGEIVKYRVRLYSGSNYHSTPVTQRRVITSTTTWAIPDWIPTLRPVYAMVKAKNRAGVSAEWSNVVTLTNSTSCPCTN